jgi:ribosomal protein S18 acetylase RimI-like enzyme
LALRLRPLRDDELPAYIEHGRAAYARDLESQAGLTADAAASKAEQDWARLFPEGALPDGNHLYVVEDAETGERVGDLWWAERPNDAGEPSAFVYNVQISPECRGRGYGREAMELFEQDAGEHGLTQFNLTVLGGNDVARGLYRSLGYSEQAVFMSKNG